MRRRELVQQIEFEIMNHTKWKSTLEKKLPTIFSFVFIFFRFFPFVLFKWAKKGNRKKHWVGGCVCVRVGEKNICVWVCAIVGGWLRHRDCVSLCLQNNQKLTESPCSFLHDKKVGHILYIIQKWVKVRNSFNFNRSHKNYPCLSFKLVWYLKLKWSIVFFRDTFLPSPWPSPTKLSCWHRWRH